MRAFATAALLGLAACASSPVPRGELATQSVLEAVVVLRLHVDDDTYRFPPARDVTGKSVYRAALARLESLETLHASKLGSGYLTDTIWFAKGRALERLGEFELAAAHYRRVSELDSELAAPARASADVCARLAALRAAEPARTLALPASQAEFERRTAALAELASTELVASSHYRFTVAEEIERGDWLEAGDLAARAALDPRLVDGALERAQRLVRAHPDSKYRARNLLVLGDLYADLSRRYAEAVPPASLAFDPATFDEYALGAAKVYEVVAAQDGSVEKLEAAHKLEAFLSYTLRVHEEKLPR